MGEDERIQEIKDQICLTKQISELVKPENVSVCLGDVEFLLSLLSQAEGEMDSMKSRLKVAKEGLENIIEMATIGFESKTIDKKYLYERLRLSKENAQSALREIEGEKRDGY